MNIDFIRLFHVTDQGTSNDEILAPLILKKIYKFLVQVNNKSSDIPYKMPTILWISKHRPIQPVNISTKLTLTANAIKYYFQCHDLQIIHRLSALKVYGWGLENEMRPYY
jgi:hypothetical protein